MPKKKPKLVEKECEGCTRKWKLLGLCSACVTEIEGENGKTIIWDKPIVEGEK